MVIRAFVAILTALAAVGVPEAHEAVGPFHNARWCA